MKIAYLILAHNNPKQLHRLVKSLASSSSGIFVHIDRKSDIKNFSEVMNESVSFSRERVAVYWRDFSIVEATLILLREAVAHIDQFDYYVVLSGNDYPLRSQAYIINFFNKNKGREFMNIIQMPCKRAGKPLFRLTTYKPRPGDSKLSKTICKIPSRLLSALSYRRDYQLYFQGLQPYAGSAWWALSREACQHILHFIEEEKQLIDFYKNTINPDESLFQTILGNSPYQSRIVRNVTYTDWSGGRAHPINLTERHLEFFQKKPIILEDIYGKGELLFARKFSNDAEKLIRKLDQIIRESED
ncbi:MAG: beta-1,6-N-acetylglucosaminyltransferase [Candidatus Electrothrix aestuarii]|uniref:Peptide O-xylosyltransferase n=1 Tax=Candidatus Electrothrix aestuarii TaxID=3062594 RepID=A0AAU8M1L2_9BACT|nr:beta-1,6-N-acetylglucosaminyltransferase [Candidatus Electrothrix aestuarii]